MFRHLFLFCLGLVVCTNSACASDSKNFKHPHFIGVERVYIHLDQNIPLDVREELPESLHVENVQKILVDIYKKRFSSTECIEFFRPPYSFRNPYGCNDQPVTVIENSSAFEELHKYKFDPITNDPSTLNVILRMRIQKDRKGYKERFEIPMVVFSFLQYRPEMKTSRATYGLGPVAYPLTWKSETLELSVKGFIASHIH